MPETFIPAGTTDVVDAIRWAADAQIALVAAGILAWFYLRRRRHAG